MNLDKNSLVKYSLVTSLMFGLAHFLTEDFLEYHESVFQFLPSVLVFVTLAVLRYIAITYLIDDRTEILINAMLRN